MTSRDLPVYRASTVSDLINSLPTFFGFRVTESLVAAVTEGPRHRMGFRLRVDLPKTADDIASVAVQVATALNDYAHDGVVLVALGEDPALAEEVVRQVADLVVAPVIEGVWATENRYWTLGDDSAEGFEHVHDEAHESILMAMEQGQEILANRAMLEDELVAYPSAGAERTGQILAEVVESLPDLTGTEIQRRTLTAGRTILGRLMAGQTVSELDVVTMAVWCRVHELRDAWWFDLTEENSAQAYRAWLHIGRSVPGAWGVVPLALAGFASWVGGNGARARVAAEAAAERGPEFAFPQTLLGVIEHAVDPRCWEDIKRHSRTGQHADRRSA